MLLLDKPAGLTSQRAVSRAKALLAAAKVGHTGTLDPMATGLLPLTVGEATKFSHALLDADKSYRATVRLGVTTTTGDLEGSVLRRESIDIETPRIEAALREFTGEILQTPPMYSALKHAGKPLYEYARAGAWVDRAARAVHIGSLELKERHGVDLVIDLTCSKGTYVRVLAEDLGRALGCGACLAALRRTRVGRFTLARAVDLDAFEAMSEAERLARLLPVDALLAGLPRLDLDAEGASRMLLGQVVELAEPIVGLARIYGPGSRFLGVGEATPAGRVAPRRLVATKPGNS